MKQIYIVKSCGYREPVAFADRRAPTPWQTWPAAPSTRCASSTSTRRASTSGERTVAGMGYSGWRFSCDRGTLERCAGALEIKSDEIGAKDPIGAAYSMEPLRALRCIVKDGDGIEPTEFVGQVLSGMGGA